MPTTNAEKNFADVLFATLAVKIKAAGLTTPEALSEALDMKPGEASGYTSAIRENRPWCVGTSLTLIDSLGWKLSFDIGG